VVDAIKIHDNKSHIDEFLIRHNIHYKSILVTNLNLIMCKLQMAAEAVVVVIAWYLDLQLTVQSMPITTDVVSSNLDQGEVYNIM